MNISKAFLIHFPVYFLKQMLLSYYYNENRFIYFRENTEGLFGNFVVPTLDQISYPVACFHFRTMQCLDIRPDWPDSPLFALVGAKGNWGRKHVDSASDRMEMTGVHIFNDRLFIGGVFFISVWQYDVNQVKVW